MGMKNPQGDFEDSIFGPNGMHPNPKTLPYPTQPLKTLYGDTIEYLIPEGQKEKVLKKLFPFGDPPPMNAVWMDIHAHREFRISDFKVIEQNGYVMLVSPYFAEDGASVVDWQSKEDEQSGMTIAPMQDEVLDGAYSAGYADGFTGMPEGSAKPPKAEGMSAERYRFIEDVYAQGYKDACDERMERRAAFDPDPVRANRRSARRP